MKKLISAIILAGALAVVLLSQNFTNLFSFTKITADPGTCTVGQTYFNTTSNTPRYCSATNTWSAYGGSGALVLLEQHTASSSSVLNFTSWYSSSYDVYKLEFVSMTVSVNVATIQVQVSTDGGSTYDTGSNYDWQSWAMVFNGSGASGGNAQTSWTFVSGIDNAANAAGVGSFTLFDPANTSLYKYFTGLSNIYNSARPAVGQMVSGAYLSTSAYNAFRVQPSSGTFSGIVRVYGVSH